jgi:hypothetical protein
MTAANVSVDMNDQSAQAIGSTVLRVLSGSVLNQRYESLYAAHVGQVNTVRSCTQCDVLF